MNLESMQNKFSAPSTCMTARLWTSSLSYAVCFRWLHYHSIKIWDYFWNIWNIFSYIVFRANGLELLSNYIIEFTEYKSTKDYLKRLRLVRCFGKETRTWVCFSHKCDSHFFVIDCRTLQEPLANRTVLQMTQAAPQNKKIRGITENTMRIQIYVAICTYLLIAIVKSNMKPKKVYMKSSDFKYFTYKQNALERPLWQN